MTEHGLSQKSAGELQALQRDLHIQRMKLDKFFSTFLDQTDFDPEDTSSPDTITYNEMAKTYRNVSRMIDIVNFYLNQHDRHSSPQNCQRILAAH